MTKSRPLHLSRRSMESASKRSTGLHFALLHAKVRSWGSNGRTSISKSVRYSSCVRCSE
jgi:hypothetical protein